MPSPLTHDPLADAARPRAPGPGSFATRTLGRDDDACVFDVPSTATATVPKGMPPNFGCGFRGAGVLTVAAGTGVTVNDVRSSGATNPWCALVQVGVDTYDVTGTKA